MNDDYLRERLAGLDPMPPSIPVDLSTSPRAQDLLERVMLTTEPTPDSLRTTPVWRKPAVLAAAAAAVAALGVGSVLATNDAAPTKPRTTLALQAPADAGGATMNSCLMFSVDFLKGMPVAFGGTVSQIGGDTVTLEVDRWFKGGSADLVTVAMPPGNISIDTVEFVKGTRYLVTASEGTVSSCGFSGVATPEFEASFEQAFAP